jgi:hypothetical protein
MSYDRNPSYERLLAHTLRHGIKKWLLRGTYREDAQTIRAAIKRMSSREIAKRLARILAQR